MEMTNRVCATVADPGSAGAVSAVEGSTAAPAVNPGDGGGDSSAFGGVKYDVGPRRQPRRRAPWARPTPQNQSILAG